MVDALNRRSLLGGAAGIGLGVVLAARGSALGTLADLAAPTPQDGAVDPFRGGELESTLAFTGERRSAVGRRTGFGLDGRLAFDLSALEGQGSPIVPTEQFFVRTSSPRDLPPAEGWSIQLGGLAGESRTILARDLVKRARPRGVQLLECSGNSRSRAFGLLSAASWKGVLLTELLQDAEPAPGARSLLVSGMDPGGDGREADEEASGTPPHASWIFPFQELKDRGAFLATHMNGEPLPPDHGRPVRLIVPGYYGCACIKWVNRLAFVGQREPSTEQMREFASRTHQRGAPALAKDFRPANMDLAAMPVRVERWRIGAEVLHRIVGIVWGGERAVESLMIRIGEADPESVSNLEQKQNSSWTLWSHPWRPSAPGNHRITLSVDDSTVSTRRLDRGFYARVITVPEDR